jgi:creatinine amidohydrolase
MLSVPEVLKYESEANMYTSHQKNRLEYKTWKEVQDYLKEQDTIIVPIGSIEQHGPGCPLLTDTIIAEYLALQVGSSSGVLVSPPIPMGDSLSHLGFPGTISLKPTTLILVIKEYITSLYKAGFRRFLLVNGHGDNYGIILAAFSELGEEVTNLRYEVQDFWDFPAFRDVMEEHFGDRNGGHADACDASVLMAIDPSLVQTDALDSGYATVSYRVSRDLINQYYTTSGVINSDQRLATPEIGQKLVQEAIKGYEKVLRNLQQ